MMDTEKFFKEVRVLPVVVIRELDDTENLLSSLRTGGINAAEITFRTVCARDAIKRGCELFPDMCIGAGTIINAKQAREALEAGARFIVSPGLSEGVAEVCREADVPYFPGCVTPTEIMAALELGITTVKFFPANVYGGLKAIKALAAPFTQVKFLPTGGADLTNLSEFLEYDKIAAVGGSFIMKGDIVENCKAVQRIVDSLNNK